MDMYRVCGAAALLAVCLSSACRRHEPPPTQEARTSPAEIAAEYGNTWVLGGDWISLERDQLVMRPADAARLAQKLLDYHVCESVAKREPGVCRADGLGKILPATPAGVVSMSLECLRFHGQFLMAAQLLSGADIQDSCPLFVEDGTPPPQMARARRLCAGAKQAYKSGGFAAAYASLAGADDLPSSWSRCKGFPQNPEAYRDNFGCRVSAAMITALQDKDASKCPPEFKSSCEALLAEAPSASCAQAAAEINRLYASSPRTAAGDAARAGD
ncbi:MAG: hypothetical protein WC728_07940 [Elusimicrobiota bacterium]